MSDFYDRITKTANALLDRFGQTVQIVRETAGAIDPITGQVTAGQVETFRVFGVVNAIDDKLIDDTRILATDRMVVIESKVKPLMTDKITVDGATWSIEEIKESSPAGKPIVYHIRIRK